MKDRSEVARHCILICTASCFVLPLYITLISAFRATEDIVRSPLSPTNMTLDPLRDAISSPTFKVAAAYRTSILITMSSVLILLLVASMIAYWIARSNRRMSVGLEGLLLVGLMIPPQVILLPVLKVLDTLGLLFTLPGLVLYNVGLYVPLATLILSRFIRAVPIQLEEAAAIDGAGPLRIFSRIVFPIMRPALVTLAVLLTIFIWNDFVNPLILLGSGRGETVTTGIYRAVGTYSTNFSAVFANILIVSAPMIVLYLMMQRRVIGAFASGGVKG